MIKLILELRNVIGLVGFMLLVIVVMLSVNGPSSGGSSLNLVFNATAQLM